MISDSTIQEIRQFVSERGWHQFHTPENLAKSISVEAGELLECYQWGTQAKPDIDHVQEELADVLMYCIMMADVLNVNMNDVILSKLESNKRKYPVKAVQSDPHAFEELHWQAKGY